MGFIFSIQNQAINIQIKELGLDNLQSNEPKLFILLCAVLHKKFRNEIHPNYLSEFVSNTYESTEVVLAPTETLDSFSLVLI